MRSRRPRDFARKVRLRPIPSPPEKTVTQAQAIFAYVGGRSAHGEGRRDLSLFDDVMAGCRAAGLVPAYHLSDVAHEYAPTPRDIGIASR